ncbi:MAG: hypothetical protein HY685_04830 [Chloroflexi bacterium]|nr:hypothetical protein [Chloroflexota bacterium]
MAQQVVGVFPSEWLAWEAAGTFSGAGYARRSLTLLAPTDVPQRPPAVARRVQTVALMERAEAPLRAMLRWAVIGAVAVEVGVMLPVLVLVESAPVELFLGASVWKLGAFFGGFVGLFLGEGQGLEPRFLRHYEGQLALGASLLVARVRGRDLPWARGVMIEGGSSEVRNVEGTFVALKDSAAKNASEVGG